MTVLIKNAQRKHKLNVRELRRKTQKILAVLGLAHSELSLCFMNDEKIRSLNSQYRDVDRATDVLSFSQSEGDPDDPDEPKTDLLGDLAVSVATASRQAREHQLSLQQELILLIIHGILHLRGMDHEKSDREAEAMRRKTRKIFSEIFPGKRPGPNCPF